MVMITPATLKTLADFEQHTSLDEFILIFGDEDGREQWACWLQLDKDLLHFTRALPAGEVSLLADYLSRL